MIEWPKTNDALGTANRGNPCESGLCTLCDAACKGKCETWLSSMRGRELIYPRDFGNITSGANQIVAVGVGYHGLRIQGYCYGANGLKKGESSSADHCIFPNVDVTARFGRKIKVKSRLPIMTGALGSTFIAAKYWEPLAIGAALAGFPIVIGENVVGVDRKSVWENGKLKTAPELDRRIDTYLRYYDGFGDIFVQMNVEDTRNGVAEYLIEKYGDQLILELKWGQGAKNIGGEIQVTSLDYARLLKDRGYIVDPDPYDPMVAKAYEEGGIKSFARHSRLGGTDLPTWEAVHEAFMKQVQYLRGLGYNRLSLKTGSYGMEGLAMAMRCASEAELDLLTIDGSGGGTGMSPWNMMQQWGIPSLHLHARAWDFARRMEKAGRTVPDLSFGGGFAREDHLFKALALGAPYCKMVCLGRAPMIPAFLGSNIEGVFNPARREHIHGNWDKLPATVSTYGSRPEEIFICWEEVVRKVGVEEMSKISFGAIAAYTLADKLRCGLQQLLAGARKFNLTQIDRSDLVAANRETAAETGLPFMTELDESIASKILGA